MKHRVELQPFENVYQIGDHRWIQILRQANGDHGLRSRVHCHHWAEWNWEIECLGCNLLRVGNHESGPGEVYAMGIKSVGNHYIFLLGLSRFVRLPCKSSSTRGANAA